MIHTPLAWLTAILRGLLPWTLVGLVVFGSWRFFSRPLQVGALEFTPHTVNGATTAEGVNGVAAVDMDNDGDIDVVTAGKDGTKVYINDGAEKFEAKLVDDKDGERVQVIDLNRDGTQDLLVTLTSNNPSVIWYDNRGEIEFEGTTIGTGTGAVAYAGDINGDGQPDIVTALNSGGNILLQRWMNSGGSFTATTLDSNSGVTSLTIGDLDGNGYQDIVTGGSKGLQRWHTTDGNTWSRIDVDDKNGNKTHLVTADVDKDGKTDIVTGDGTENLVAWYDNQDNSTWKRIEVADSIDVKTVAVRDLDEDGDEDIIIAAQDDNSVFWYENGGKSEFIAENTAAANLAGVYGVAVNDIDSDNDFDFVAGDHVRGTVWWYERTRAKPTATKPGNIQQATDGSGRVTFETTLRDGDSDPTRVRLQYSTDGVRWFKPWLTKVVPSVGKVDLKNSNGYQVGTKDAIDTTNSQKVKLTFTWDAKSAENTGGGLTGDVSGVQLRVIPRDDGSTGGAATSNTFRVDLAAPKNLKLTLSSMTTTEAQLAWTKPSDSSTVSYKIYFGTDAQAVTELKSEVWDENDDGELADFETTSTTITGLSANQTYTFKLVATDKFGNSAAAASVQGRSVAPTATATPTPSAEVPGESPAPTASPTATPPGFVPGTTVPLPAVTPPSTLIDNTAPLADAGLNQVVNPSALVILDGTASSDLDRDSLTYTWRQISGPRVELLSARTATPSFSAGEAGTSYIFQLTVRDPRGALGLDTVTVAVKELPEVSTVPVQVSGETPGPTSAVTAERSGWLTFLNWLDFLLFGAAVLSTSVSLAARLSHSLRQQRFFAPAGQREAAAGKVVHYQTGEPIAGVQILIYGEDGKIKNSERTNDKGEFPTLLPAGRYTLDVRASGFAFAGAGTRLPAAEGAIVYTGGTLTVPRGNRPVRLVVPMKPVGPAVGSARTRLLHLWQLTQRVGRGLSWPLFVAGALLNTYLVFRSPSALYLTIEILYVVLVVVKVVLEVRVRPAYGLVRDAITHVPLDLAVVRLYEGGTNRLIMTRVTNAQGKFFALPSAGTYTVTITKPGYAVFSKGGVHITFETDSALQITADLMPVAPKAMLPTI